MIDVFSRLKTDLSNVFNNLMTFDRMQALNGTIDKKGTLPSDFLNGHQNLCMNTGSDPKCDTCDRKNRDK